MPNHEEHCQHSRKRYGVRGDEIHHWLDEPAKFYGKYHRKYRHDSETVEVVGEIFGNKYGRALAENIALDHLALDREMSAWNRNGYQVRNMVPLRGKTRFVLILFKIAVTTIFVALQYPIFMGAQLAWSFISWNLGDAIVSGFVILFFEMIVVIALFFLWRK